MNAVEIEEQRRAHIAAIRHRHYLKYRDRYIAQSREWRKRNPDKVKANNDKKPRKTDRRLEKVA